MCEHIQTRTSYVNCSAYKIVLWFHRGKFHTAHTNPSPGVQCKDTSLLYEYFYSKIQHQAPEWMKMVDFYRTNEHIVLTYYNIKSFSWTSWAWVSHGKKIQQTWSSSYKNKREMYYYTPLCLSSAHDVVVRWHCLHQWWQPEFKVHFKCLDRTIVRGRMQHLLDH